MPVYCFDCEKCGAKKEVIRPMSQHAQLEPCECGYVMRRDLGAEAPGGLMEFTTIWSEALGVAPSQVAEHRRAHPNIPIRDDGVVGFNRASQVAEVCRKLGPGWEER